MNYVIVAIFSAVLAFGSAWQIQNWRADAHAKQTITATIVAQSAAHAEQQARTDAVIVAQNDARGREITLRADADRARGALAGLRQSTDAALQTAAGSLNACLDTATTTAELLNTSAGKYQELAESADRHVNDIQTLRGAWPR